MKLETKRILTLTKAEQKTIHDLYGILDDDESLDANAVWDILTDIFLGDIRGYAEDYGYKIEIVD